MKFRSHRNFRRFKRAAKPISPETPETTPSTEKPGQIPNIEDEFPIEKINRYKTSSLDTLAAEAAGARNKVNLTRRVIHEYTANASLGKICLGIQQATDDELRLHLGDDEIPVQKTLIETIENQHRILADRIFRGKNTEPNPFEPGKEIPPQDPNRGAGWFMAKTGDNMEQHRSIATLIELKSKPPGGVGIEDHLLAAHSRIPTQIEKVRNTCNHADPVILAAFKLTRDQWDLEQRIKDNPAGKDACEKEKQRIIEKRNSVFESAATTTTANILSNMKEIAAHTTELMSDDKRRKELHDLAATLKDINLDNTGEKKALALLPPNIRRFYSYKTLSPGERKELWRQIARLTEKPLNHDSATRLMALQLGVTSQHCTDEAIDHARSATKEPRMQIARLQQNEKDKTENQRKHSATEREHEQRDRAHDRQQQAQSIAGHIKTVMEESGKGLNMDH